MRVRPHYSVRLGLVGACALLAGSLSAAPVASDSAADPVYDDGWQHGDNGGTGWGAWILENTASYQRHFIGNSAGNGDGDTSPPVGDINTPGTASGRAWGLGHFTPAGTLARVTHADRPFGGDLSVGQTFSLDFDNGTVTGGFPSGVGVALGDTYTGGRQFVWELQISGGEGPGSTSYSVQGREEPQFGPAFTDEGLHIDFTLLAANRYLVAVTPLGGETTTYTGTLRGSGQADASPDLVRFYNLNGGNTAAGESFYNNMAIGQVPEPSAFAALALGGLLCRRRRGGCACARRSLVRRRTNLQPLAHTRP